MYEKAKSGRDAFTFSLHGMTTIASFTLAPAVADDYLNQVSDRRSDRPRADRAGAARAIEDFLARYFAPGYC